MRLLLMLVLIAASALASAQAYRWVDNDGKVHYSDTPPTPGEASRVEQKRLSSSVIEGAGPLSYEAKRAAEAFPVTLYTAPDCAQSCQSGRDLLRRHGIPFAEKSLQSEEDYAAYRKTIGVQEITLPTLSVGRQIQKGFEATLWTSQLESAGYPLKSP
jgi:glutaredoxin